MKRIHVFLSSLWRLKRVNRSLSVDLTVGMLVILVLIEGAFLYAIYQRQSSAMRKDIELKAEDYAAKLGEVLAVPIWDYDDEQIQKVGKGFLQNDLMAHLRIIDPQGRELLLLSNTDVGGRLIRRSALIDYNTSVIGRVDIALSTAAYDRERLWLRNVLLTVFFCSVLIFFVASGLLLRFFLRQPLAVLAHGMDRIADGDFDQQDQNLSYTELAGIAGRFSQMASRIKDREKALVDMNRQLQTVNTRLRQRFKYEKMLAEVSARAATQVNFDRFAEESLRLIGEAFACRWIGLYAWSSDSRELSLTARWPAGGPSLGPIRLAETAGSGPLIASLRENRRQRFDLGRPEDPHRVPELLGFDASLRSLLMFPLSGAKGFYGGIVFGRADDAFSGKDVGTVLETAVQIILRTIESAQAWEMLQRSEERFREMAEMLPETIFEMDFDGRLTYVNRSGLKQFGYSDSDLQRGLAAIDMFDPQEHPRLRQNIQMVRDGRGTRLKEYRACHKNGTCFPAMVSSSPIRKAGQTAGIRGFVIDISDKKNLEARLRKASRMEAIGNLAAGVAHDLNNILSGLVGYPDLLLLDLPPESPLRPSVEAIKSTGQKAAAVVQDLLTLARRNISELQIVNLNDIIRDYLGSPEFLQLVQHHATVRMSSQLADDLMNLKGSAHHVSKGLMNLVVNAVEAMPAGGSLEIRTRNCYVDRAIAGFETIPEGEYAVLSVIDSGIGISRQDMQSIFEPFYTKKRMGRSGTGLGMSVVWATVKDHAGFVDVDSQEGRGTRFDIYFPASREKTAPRPSSIPVEDYLGSEHILVVDDIPEQRQIATNMLERLGYTVQTVPSGEAAIDVIRHHTVDLVILDMVMDPGIDGLETYRRLLALVPDQKAIIASGFAETERVKAALQLGAGAYVKKPYSLEKIGVSVRAALDHRHST